MQVPSQSISWSDGVRGP